MVARTAKQSSNLVGRVIVVYCHAVDEFGLMYPADRAFKVLLFEHRLKVLEGNAVLENEFAVLDVLINFVSRGKGGAFTGHVVFLNRAALLFVNSPAMFASTDPLGGLARRYNYNVIVLFPD